MGGKRRKPKAGEGTTGQSFSYTPSAIHVDHARNMRRLAYPTIPELVKYIGPKCTHSAENIEARLASFKAKGQLQPCGIYLTSTNDAFLVWGYLRHLAALLAEVRGELDACKFKSPERLMCIQVSEPTCAADWLTLADQNVAENAETVSLTAIDTAEIISRYLAPVGEGGFDLTRAEVAERMGVQPRTISWYLRLLKLHPSVIMKIHTGELKPTVALEQAKERGEAGSPGPRSGLKKAAMKRALTHADKRPPPKVDLVDTEIQLFGELLTGVKTFKDLVDDKGNSTAPAAVRQWVEWFDAPDDLGKKPKSSGKKAPPKPGESS